MPKFCNTKEEAVQRMQELGDSMFPATVVVWTVHDVRDSYLDEDDESLLTEEEAAEVLASLAHDFDASRGLNWDRIIDECEHMFPKCYECKKLKKDCGCKDA